MSRPYVACGLLLVVGAWLRFSALDFGSPSAAARPDEELLLKESLARLDGDEPARFFSYPAGLPRLQSWVFRFLRQRGSLPGDGSAQTQWRRDPMAWHLAGRAISAVGGMLTILLCFVAGRRVGGDGVGLGAAAVMALAPLAVLHSHFATVDVPGMLVVAAVLALAAKPSPGAAALLLAAFLAGAAAGIKYTMAVAILLPALTLPGRPRWKLWLLLMTIAFGLGIGLTSPPVFLDLAAVLQSLRNEAAGQALRRGDLSVWSAARHFLVVALGAGLTWPLFLLALAGFFLPDRLPGGTLPTGLRLAAPLVLLFVLHAFVGVPYARYFVPVLPILALAAGFAAARLLPRLPPGLDLLGLAILFALPLLRDLQIRSSLSRLDTRGELVRAFADGRLPQDSLILAPVWPFQAWPLDTENLVRFAAHHGADELKNIVGAQGLVIVWAETGEIFSDPASLAWVTATRHEVETMIRDQAIGREVLLVLEPGLGLPEDYEAFDFFFTPLVCPLVQERPGPRIEVWRLWTRE